MNNFELIEQWTHIKKAYKAIIENAFSTQQERQYAEYIIVKFIGSGIDLYLTGDLGLKNAVNALIGSQTRQPAQGATQVPMPPMSPNMQMPHNMHMPSNMQMPQNTPPIPNPSLPFFPFMNDSRVTPPQQINNDDLRQLFSFWSSFENGFAPPPVNDEHPVNENVDN